MKQKHQERFIRYFRRRFVRKYVSKKGVVRASNDEIVQAGAELIRAR